MKLAICNETYVGWDFERVCADVAAAGYDGIELSLAAIDPDPSSIDERRAAELGAVARAAGLEVVGLHWLLVAPAGLHLTTPDADVRGRTVGHLCHLARLCAAAGGRVIVLGSPKQRDVAEGDAYEDAFARAADGCRRVAEVAGPLGVTLAIEPLAAGITNFVTTAAEGARLVRAVDHPAFGLHLDAGAAASEGRGVDAVIREHGRDLVHFHANDPNGRGPGTGDLDFAPIVRALREVEYGGFVSVEVFDYEPGGPEIARSSLEYLKSVC